MLALSYDVRGFVGPKEKTIVVLLVFNPIFIYCSLDVLNWCLEQKNEKKFLRARCSLWREGGFSWSLEVYWRANKKKNASFEIKKTFFSLFSPIFAHQNLSLDRYAHKWIWILNIKFLQRLFTCLNWFSAFLRVNINILLLFYSFRVKI